MTLVGIKSTFIYDIIVDLFFPPYTSLPNLDATLIHIADIALSRHTTAPPVTAPQPPLPLPPVPRAPPELAKIGRYTDRLKSDGIGLNRPIYRPIFIMINLHPFFKRNPFNLI